MTENKTLYVFFFLLFLCFCWSINSGEIEEKLAKVERDFPILHARLIWDWEWKGGRIPLPDYVFLLPPQLQEAMRLKYHLLNTPNTIEENDFREFNRRICDFLTRNDKLIHDFRTIFHFRKDMPTSDSVHLLIEKYCTDPFKEQGLYDYFGMITIKGYQTFILKSNGPDKDMDLDFLDVKWENGGWVYPKSLREFWYDPTNGLLSSGDIFTIFEAGPDYKLEPPDFLETPFGKKINQNVRKTLQGSNDEFWEAIGHPCSREE